MVNVAIAGGSSPTLGRSIVKGILNAGRHTPIILSRPSGQGSTSTTASTTVEVDGRSVVVRHVSYHDHGALLSALRDVHTVISVVLVPDPQEWVSSQVNLLNAAKEAGVKRFAPSEWAFGGASHDKAPIDAPKTEVWEAVEKSGLEATRFVCGGFMNYLGIGCPGSKEKQAEALAGFGERPYLFGVRDGWAEIPLKSDGSYPRLTMTELGDIGRFVAAALDLDKWESEMPMAGDVLSFGEVLRLAEQVTGRTFKIKEVTKDDWKRELDGLAPEDWMRNMECWYGMLFCDDVDGETALDPLLNRLCPQVKPISIGEYLQKYWSSADSGAA